MRTPDVVPNAHGAGTVQAPLCDAHCRGNTHAHTHTCASTYAHTHVRTHTHTHTRTHAHTHKRTNAQTHKRANAQTRKRTRAHTYTYIYIYMHVQEPLCDVNCRDKEHNTPLHWAAAQGDAPALRLLLSRREITRLARDG